MAKVLLTVMFALSLVLVSCQNSDTPTGTGDPNAIGSPDKTAPGGRGSLDDPWLHYRPISDFTGVQGTHNVWQPYGDEIGWTDPATNLFAYADYCGLAVPYCQAHGVNLGTRVRGTLTEQEATVGRLVHVRLETTNALTWVVSGMDSMDIMDHPTIFGARGQAVAGGARAATSFVTFEFVFVDSLPVGSPMPDLVESLMANFGSWPYIEIHTLDFYSRGTGPLHAGSGWPEGSNGALVVQQTAHDLFANGFYFSMESDLLRRVGH